MACEAADREIRRVLRGEQKSVDIDVSSFEDAGVAPEVPKVAGSNPASRLDPAVVNVLFPPETLYPKQHGTAVPLRRVLLIPDSHIPYEDPHAFGLMLRAAHLFKPDEIDILGDFADFYSVSSHSKNPNRVQFLAEELDKVKARRAQLDLLGASKKVYIAGNHEDRLERYLADRAPAIFNSVKIEDVLDLRANGWQYVPYKHHYKLGKLHITHDVGSAGRNANRQAMDTYQGSAVIGHTHRMEMSVMGNADGPPQLGIMLGWLGDFDKVDYLHEVQSKRNWVHGFGIGYQDTETGVVYVTPVPIINRTCVVNGQLVR